MNFTNKLTSAVVVCCLLAVAIPGIAEEASININQNWPLAKRAGFADVPEILSEGVVLKLDDTTEPRLIRGPVPEDSKFVLNADSRIIFTISGDHVAQTVTGGNWRLGGSPISGSVPMDSILKIRRMVRNTSTIRSTQTWSYTSNPSFRQKNRHISTMELFIKSKFTAKSGTVNRVWLC